MVINYNLDSERTRPEDVISVFQTKYADLIRDADVALYTKGKTIIINYHQKSDQDTYADYFLNMNFQGYTVRVVKIP